MKKDAQSDNSAKLRQKAEEEAKKRFSVEDLLPSTAEFLKLIKELGVKQVELEMLGEEQLKTILRTAIDGFHLVDTEGRILDTNDSYCSMIGYSREELLKMKVKDIEAADTEEVIKKRIQRILETGNDRFVTKHICKDGQVIDIEASVNLLTNGQPLICCFMRDITERIKAEAQLRLQSEIMSHLSEAVYLVRLEDGIIVYSNSRFEKMFGYEPGEMLGKNVSIVNAPTEKSPELTAIEILNDIRKSGFWQGEIENIRKDGTRFWSYARVNSFNHTQFGNVLVDVHEDITEKKQTEEIIRQQTHAMDSSINGLAIINSDFKYIYVNRSHVQIYGYEHADELMGESWRILYTPDELQRFDREVMPELSQTGYYYGEAQGKKKDGSTFHQTISLTILKNGGLICSVYDITEQKKSEAALRQSEERFRLLIENSHDAIALISADGTVIYDSPSIENILGYSPGERIGRKVFEFVPQEKREGMEHGYYKFALQKGAVGYSEVSFIHKDGSLRHIEAIRTNLLHEPAVGGVVVNFHDITEQKRANEALFESRQMLKVIIDTIPARVFWKDKNLTYLGCNTQFAQDAGFGKPEDIIGKDDYAMGWHEQAELYRADDLLVIGSGNPKLDYEEMQTTPSGDNIWLLSSKVPLRDASGEITALLGTYIDITGRKRAEEALRESEEKYRVLFEGSTLGILATDIETHQFLYSNPAICQIFGYSDEEFLRLTIPDLHQKDSMDLVISEFESQMRGEKVISSALPCLRKDGTVFYADIAGNSTIINGRKCSVGFFVDVTTRKQAEDALRQSRKELNSLFEASPEMISFIGFDGYFKQLNPAWVKTLGYPMDKLLSLPFIEFVHPDDREATNAEVAKLADGQRTILFENRYRCNDGSYRWLAWSVIPDTKEKLLYAVARDITEHKKQEEELKKSEEKYRTLFESMVQGVVYQDSEGIAFDQNAAAERILGLSLEQLQGRKSIDPRWKAIHEDGTDFPGETHPSMVSLRTGKKVENVIMGVYNPKLNDHAWINVNASPQFNEGETKPFRVYSSFEDITDRKKAEEKLKESEEKFRTLFQNHSAIKLIVDPDNGNIVDANFAATKFYGWPVEKLKTMNMSEINTLSPAEIKKVMNLVKNKVKNYFEFKHRKADGSICDVSIDSGIINFNGERHLYSIVRNITEYKKLEEERNQALKKLRAFAAMLQDNREEERKSIAREIHDEFGQVLTAIKMNLTMLGKETTKTVESSIATSILSEIANMKQIINETIHKVRVFTNKLRPDVLDTFGLFEALDTHITEFDKLHGIKCNFVIPDEEIEIDSDKSIAVYRIVQEALTNVARHAKATEVDISISKQDNFLNVSIEDNGKGIERTQLDDAKSFGIIGMKERAYICGGTLLLTSEPGKGTKIDLSMPIKEND